MTTTVTTRNGVDTAALFATIDAVAAQPELGRFQFRASNRWISGTHNETTINGFYGAGQQHTRAADHTVEADHPAVLCGEDNAATPAELLLAALAACLTSGLGNIAAARGITLSEVTSTVEGDIDLRGIFGITDEVRNGFERIRVHFTVTGDGTSEQMTRLVEQAKRRSAVFDVLTNGVPVEIDVTTR